MTETTLTSQISGQMVRSSGTGVPWPAAIEVFRGSLAGRTKRTVEIYTDGVKRLWSWADDRGIDTVTAMAPADLVAYRAMWQTKLDAGEYMPSLVSNRLVAARRFLLHCSVEGFLSPAMTRERILTYLQSPKDPRAKRLPTYLDRAEIKALLDAVHTARDRAIFTLALGSGLRVSELLGLHVAICAPCPAALRS